MDFKLDIEPSTAKTAAAPGQAPADGFKLDVPPTAAGGGTPEDFVRQYLPVAERVSARTGIAPNVLLGQWGLETGWGKSIIPETNNLGNIKDFSGGGVKATDNMTGSRDGYMKFDSPDAFGDHYSGLLSRKYGAAKNVGSDATKFFSALKAGGYAEDPAYISKGVAAAQMAARFSGAAAPTTAPTSASQAPQYIDIKPRPDATVGDYAKEVVASGVEGVGSIGQFFGEGAAKVANAVTGTEDYVGKNLLKPASEGIRESMTDGGKRARQEAAFEGDFVDALTGDWSKIKTPETLEGWLMTGAQGLGSIIPTILPVVGQVRRAGQLAKAGDAAGAAAAGFRAKLIGGVTGGAVTGGAAADEVRSNIAKLFATAPHEELMASVPAYAQAFNETGDAALARAKVENAGAQWAAGLAAAAGALGGVTTAKVIEDVWVNKGLSALIGKGIASRTGRVAVGATGGAAAEGAQELTEKAGQNAGENIGLGRPAGEDVTRNSFGDVVAGAMLGTGFGGVGGAVARPHAAVEAAAEKPGSVLSRAAVAAGATQPGSPADPAVQAQANAAPDPATRLAELEAIAKGAPAGDSADATQGRILNAEEQAEYQQLKGLKDATAEIVAADQPKADPLSDKAKELAAGVRERNVLDVLRSNEDAPTDAKAVLKDLAIAQSPSTGAAQREQALARLQFVMDWVDGKPTPTTTPTGVAPRAATGDPVADAMRGNEMSDQDRSKVVDLYAASKNTGLPAATRQQRLDEALAIVGRYTAPEGEKTAAPPAAVERQVSEDDDSRDGLIARAERRERGAFQFESAGFADEAQQLRDEADSLRERAATVQAIEAKNARVTDVEAPKVATPAGDAPAALRKRKATLAQLVATGLTRVERTPEGFFLRSGDGKRQFKLDNAADAQLARAALADKIRADANAANTAPTEAQAEAGNYKKGRVEFDGLKIGIENPKDSVRSGTSPDGTKWETKLTAHYGDLTGTTGADGDGVDVYLVDSPRPGSPAFVVDQYNDDGGFDEHKVVLGVATEAEALRVYDSGFSDGSGPRRRGAVTAMPIGDFQDWARSPAAKKPAGAPRAAPAPAPAVAPAAKPDDMAETISIGVESERRELPIVRAETMPDTESVARDGRALTLTKAQAKLIEAVASAFGKKVVFFDDAGTKAGDGFVKTDDASTIYINRATGISPLAVFGHELMHQLKAELPEAHAAIEKVVKKNLVKGARESFAKLGYKKGDILEEITSDLGGDLMTDPKFWAEVFDQIQDKGIVARLIAILTDAIEALNASIKQGGFKSAELVKDMAAVRAAVRDGLAKYAAARGVSPTAIRAESLKAQQSRDRSPITIENEGKGWYVAKAGKRSVGKLATWQDSDGNFVPLNVFVDPRYRRRGVATQLYRAAEAAEGQLKPAVSLSDDAFEFWKQYRPEAVSGDLRHIASELVGRRAKKGDNEGSITAASGRGATLTFDNHPQGPGTTAYLVGSDAINDALAAAGEPRLVPDNMAIRQSVDRVPGRMDGVEAYHFSQQPRTILSSGAFGSGLKGSARDEYLQAEDKRRRARIYFYFDKGTGIRPEAGVGGYAHKASLDNVYDSNADPLKLRSGNQAAFETRLLDAGFDGYLDRLEGTQSGQIIMLGNRTIPVQAMEPGSLKKPADPAPVTQETIKRGLMSKEIEQILPKNIPGARLTAGTLVFPAAAREAANKEMARIGSPVRFSKDRPTSSKSEYEAIEKKLRGTAMWMKAPNGEPTKLTERQWIHVRTPSFKKWFGDWEAAHLDGGVWGSSLDVSKAVGENGEPLVLYHGTDTGGFAEFRRTGGQKRGDLGIWATDNRHMAGTYVKRGRNRPITEDDVGEDRVSGSYAVFMNIRDVNEDHFEGANWEGSRSHLWVVEVGGEQQYLPTGQGYFSEEDALTFAREFVAPEVDEDERDEAARDYIVAAGDHHNTTDGVVREARSVGQHGAIIREVVDDGGGQSPYAGEPANIFVAFDPTRVKSADFNNGEYSATEEDIRRSVERPQSDAFRKWFGDSKVVDAEGKPLVVYHGTALAKAAFRREGGGAGVGAYFTTKADLASEYAKMDAEVGDGDGPLVMPVYLSLRNPKIVRGTDSYGVTPEQRDAMEAQGFDGVHNPEAGEYIAFRPEQIKSAIGNIGTWSPDSGDIRYSRDRKLERVHAFEMSTRAPNAKANKSFTPEDSKANLLISNFAAAESQPKWLAAVTELVEQYPNYRPAAGATTDVKKLERLIRHMTDNLLFLHDQVPADIRQRSKLWYDGARAIVDRWVKRYDITDAQAAGVLAVLSPQKDWFMNVDLARRVIETLADRQAFRWSSEMEETASRIYAKAKYQADVDAIRGAALKDIDSPYLKAMWLRTFDQAHNPRSFMIVSPEGDAIAEARTKDGTPGKVAWGGNSTIAKAIKIVGDGSFDSISEELGRQHKVRNFFNNILVPNSPNGHVTIDTHAVAAALLRALSGNSLEVTHNFGGPGSNFVGLGGIYALYEEAYHRAAEARNLLPREMQSITWEAVRGLYVPTFKAQAKNVAAVDAVWNKFKKGRLSHDDARQEVLRLAGGIEAPSWAGRDPGAYAEDESAFEPGDLSGDGVSGGDSADDVRASRERPAAAAGIGRGGDGGGRGQGRSLAPLEGAPNVRDASGPDPRLVEVAERYAKAAGISLVRQAAYVEVDTERATRIAAAYEAMEHAPNDPAVREAYADLIEQTRAQYDALEAAGYRFTFFDGATDPYGGNPWDAMRDLRANKHMAVYGTYDGYGTAGITDTARAENPMLADTGIEWVDQAGKPHPVLANDLFRAVHDAFGHGLEGAGFRDRGEENAWQAHVRLFTGPAVGAITSETRGQNSWLNYGPYGEANRAAKLEDTVFAEQKTGLMPEWTWTEGRASDAKRSVERASWTDGRIDSLIENYAYTQSDTKTKAYAGWVSPKDFLAATTPSDEVDRLESERSPLDQGALAKEIQPIMLFGELDGDTWKINGHEGRHRMMALRDAGVSSVPVVFKRSSGEESKPERGVFVTAQRWGDIRAQKGFLVGLTPLSYAEKGEIKRRFGGGDGVKFSSERDLDGFRKSLLGKVQADVAMAKMRGAAHEWAFNIGDELLSTKTGKVYTLTGRTFQRVGKLSANDWQPVYSYSSGNPPPAGTRDEELDNWPHEFERGIFPERAILESKTLKSLTTPVMRSVDRDANFKAWFGDSQVVDTNGDPLVLYRGGVGFEDLADGFLNGQPRSNYSVFASDSPYVASSYANVDPEDRMDASMAGAVVPVYVKGVVKEFPVRLVNGERRLDFFAFDQAAGRLKPGEVLVARQVYDIGPRARAKVDPKKLYSYPSDIYAWGRGTSVKSAVGNNGDFNPSKPDITRSVERPIFYSQLEKSIASVPDRLATMAAPQWKLWLDANASKLGVKKDELEWSGIKDYLTTRGKDKVTRDDLVAYLADSGVRVTETVLGDGGLTPAEVKEVQELRDLYRRMEDGEEGVFDAADFDRLELLENRKGGDALTKYGDYTVPGGTNYREVLLTLPTPAALPAGYSPKLEKTFHGDDSWVISRPYDAPRFPGMSYRYKTEQEARSAIISGLGLGYKSSHWEGVPNIVAHLRVDDRTDADGKRVLFINEIQSDWGQAGKKDGFAKSKRVDTTGWTATESYPGSWRVLQADGTPANNGVSAPSAQDAINEIANKWEQRALKAVPPAPFVTDTKAWVALALKRAILMAADGGYDRVALITGQQAADLYDLSKRVKSIGYTPNGDGTFKLYINGMNNETLVDEERATIERVEELAGKEVASKVAASEGRPMQGSGPDTGFRSLTGLDLKVGGEGMRTFYDQIVPQVANDVLRKVGGGKAGEVRLKSARLTLSLIGQNPVVYDTETGLYYRGPKASSPWGDRKSAKQYLSLETANKAILDLSAEAGGAGVQPGFDITPAMREKLAGGAPLFSLDRGLANINVGGYTVGDLMTSSKTVGLWDKTVGTPFNLARKHPEFKRTFDAVQNFLGDVSRYATRAADQAQNFLPKLETLKDVLRQPLSVEDTEALADPIFHGTLLYARDADGNAVRTDDVGAAGVVWKDDELRGLFNLNDKQISLYREFRKAVNRSLNDLAVTDMIRYAGKDGAAVKDAMLAATTAKKAAEILVEHLATQAGENPARAAILTSTAQAIKDKAGIVGGLIAKGYAPLSRFGDYTVYVTRDDGKEQVYFGMFESEREAQKMARAMRIDHPDAEVTTGTMSKESYKLFSGVTPETLALFGESLGLEEGRDDQKSQVFQAYLQAAKTNRSAMKRMIERKGVNGYSEDAARVLAGFVYSNARQASTNLHAGEITKSASEIGPGDLKDQAIKLTQYVQNPAEEAQALRGLLFANYIGGSVASALVNLTQSATTTWPTLTQYFGATKSAGAMADALKIASSGPGTDADLAAAMKRAEEEGITAPQEVHQLMAQAGGKGSLQTGDGTKLGNTLAKTSNALSKLQLVWGKMFGWAELVNRKIAFAAAYKLARERGDTGAAAYDFAKKIVAETQFTMNKGNNPMWARGPVGATLFTFKKFSVMYLEGLARMWGAGPEGKKAFALSLGVMFVLAGSAGFPFADDLDDLIDFFAQRVLGKNFHSKQAKREFFEELLGKAGADFVSQGLSGIPGVPIDISGRLGMGNVLPGTGVLQKKRDYTSDLKEVGGAGADFIGRIATGVAQAAQGDFKNAANAVAPTAIANLVKAYQMASLGYYTDAKNRKVIDVTATEAALKAIGFQPVSVANVQDATRAQQLMIDLNKLTEGEIADIWARGRIQRKPELIDEAKERLATWNRENPSSKIEISPDQINKRVRDANKTKAQRIAATAPKEIRAAVKRELEASN